jgi:hypothetical protein
MTIHTCNKCNFSTQYKSVYDTHLISKKHYNIINNINQYNCKFCNLDLKQKSNYDKHLLTNKHNINVNKMDNSGNNINENIIISKIDNISKQNDNLAKQNQEVIKQNEDLAKKNEELQQKIEQLEKINNQNTNTIVKEARSIKKSILTILNTNFKDTPSIDYIKEDEFRVELEEEYKRKIDDETNSLFIRIFNDYKNNKLIKTLSDLTLKFIKKEDKKSQPVFNIDSSRGNFATKIEDIWFNDKSGLQLKKYTLDMVVKYMLNVLDVYRQRLDEIIKKKNKTREEIEYVMSNQDIFIEVRSFLMNTNTHKRVILYMCPELRMDDKILNAIT